MIYIDLDFETSSACELKTAGAWAYAEHPTTDILCLMYQSGLTRERWLPGEPFPSFFQHLIGDQNTYFVAHNAGFEQAIWSRIMVERFGFPPIPVWQWEDTMATAAWKAIPLALDKGAAALRLPVGKDKEGNRLTLSMSRPDKKTGMVPELTPERLERISEYCARDVVVETAMRHRIGLLSQQSRQERGIWLYDQTINQRGVRIDLDFVRQARLVIDRASKPLLAEFRELTGGVNPGQVALVKAWAGSQGVELENLQKGYLTELLGEPDADDDNGYTSLASEDDYGAAVQETEPGLSEAGHLLDDAEAAGGVRVLSVGLPDTVRRALEIRQMLGSASIKKLVRMQQCVCEDGRVRGLLQYHAASPGRWGGRLLQPQNFPRGVKLYTASGDPAPIAAVVAAVLSGDPAACGGFFKEGSNGRLFRVEPIELIAFSLRHALVADPGKVFMVGDFAGIELRVLLAMAGQHDRTAEVVEKGSGAYLSMAEQIYNIPEGQWSATPEIVDKAKKDHIVEYTIGKNTLLGCGFQMGWRVFKDRYCREQPDEFAQRVVNAYRKEWAPMVPKFWYGLDAAALKAAKGQPTEAYGVQYKLDDAWLTARLPSGWQKLWYHRPELGRDDRFDRERWTYSAYKGGKHQKNKAYGGLLVENAVQGLARGLLCAAIDRLERAGMPVVLTVHDEAIVEIDEGKADLAAFEQLMAEPTAWAREMRIPIAVEAWQGDRYRK